MGLDITLTQKQPTEVFSQNITHNLTKMADEAGMYKHIWRPEEIGIKQASEMIEPLEKMIKEMKDDPERFKQHDSPNGWGLYIHFLPWIEKYLKACKEFPEAQIEAWR